MPDRKLLFLSEIFSSGVSIHRFKSGSLSCGALKIPSMPSSCNWKVFNSDHQNPSRPIGHESDIKKTRSSAAIEPFKTINYSVIKRLITLKIPTAVAKWSLWVAALHWVIPIKRLYRDCQSLTVLTRRLPWTSDKLYGRLLLSTGVTRSTWMTQEIVSNVSC